MEREGISAVVTGGASGLGLATVRRLLDEGASVVIADLSGSPGAQVARDLGDATRFVAADVTDEAALNEAFDTAQKMGPLRALIHCAGAGGPSRLIEKDGSAGSLDHYTRVISVNMIGTFNAVRLAAVRMAANEPSDGDRGVCVLTASVAAFEGQIGQVPYASSKAGIHGMTIVAARDLASKGIRVCTIAPGTFDTPMLGRLPDEARNALASATPHPRRLGRPEEFASLACHIIDNGMLNGETIRLDGAIRMPPR